MSLVIKSIILSFFIEEGKRTEHTSNNPHIDSDKNLVDVLVQRHNGRRES